MGDSGSYSSTSKASLNFPAIELQTTQQRARAVEELLSPALIAQYLDKLRMYILTGNSFYIRGEDLADYLDDEDVTDYLDRLNDIMRRARGDVPPQPTPPPSPGTEMSDNEDTQSLLSGPSPSVGSTGGPGPSNPRPPSPTGSEAGSEVCSGISCDLIGMERDRTP